MQLHASAVALIDHPGQRIPVRLRRQALLASEVTAPGLVGAGVEGVALHAALEEDGVEASGLQGIQLTPQLDLHGIAAHALPLSVDGLDPGAAELALRRLLCADSDGHGAKPHGHEKKSEVFHQWFVCLVLRCKVTK